MANLDPARLLGMGTGIDSLEVGKKANLILINGMVRIEKVFLEGQTVLR